MRVLIPSALRSYTGGRSAVDASGGSVEELLSDIERRYPGLRFRIVDEQGGLRPHIRVSVDARVVKDLGERLRPGNEVALIMAFSGG